MALVSRENKMSYNQYNIYSTIKRLTVFIIATLLLQAGNAFSDTAIANQSIKIIIPKVALIDTGKADEILTMSFNPMTTAGDNFNPIEATGSYDVTSNIPRLRLYAQTDVDLKSNYNLLLKVKETDTDGFKELSTTAQRVSTQGKQAQTDQALSYQASPVSPNKTIPYGDINVKVTYTLVEP